MKSQTSDTGNFAHMLKYVKDAQDKRKALKEMRKHWNDMSENIHLRRKEIMQQGLDQSQSNNEQALSGDEFNQSMFGKQSPSKSTITTPDSRQKYKIEDYGVKYSKRISQDMEDLSILEMRQETERITLSKIKAYSIRTKQSVMK